MLNNNENSDFENAVEVNSVPEEYILLDMLHPDGYMLIMQQLLFNNEKPYDRLDILLNDGTEKSYYFNISTFYGKY
jgi:hypothetical protein